MSQLGTAREMNRPSSQMSGGTAAGQLSPPREPMAAFEVQATSAWPTGTAPPPAGASRSSSSLAKSRPSTAGGGGGGGGGGEKGGGGTSSSSKLPAQGPAFVVRNSAEAKPIPMLQAGEQLLIMSSSGAGVFAAPVAAAPSAGVVKLH